MLRAASLLLILTASRLTNGQYEECPAGEALVPAVNPCGTCELRGYCPQEEEPGCDCAPGLLRDALGQCVPPDACYRGLAPRSYNRPPYLPPPAPARPRCGPNEEYTDCGTACPPTCQLRSPVCDLQCVPGCFCRRGFLRREGRCVPPQECPRPPPPPPTCGPNEVFAACAPACPPTCGNRRPPCAAPCARGCACQAGYLRKGGLCVPPQECDPYAPPPQQDCPDRRKCIATCKRKGSSTGFCVGEAFRTCACRG